MFRQPIRIGPHESTHKHITTSEILTSTRTMCILRQTQRSLILTSWHMLTSNRLRSSQVSTTDHVLMHVPLGPTSNGFSTLGDTFMLLINKHDPIAIRYIFITHISLRSNTDRGIGVLPHHYCALS